MAYSLRTFGSNEINLLCGGLHYLEPEDYPGAVELLAEAGCTEIDTARMYLEKTAEGKLGAALVLTPAGAEGKWSEGIVSAQGASSSARSRRSCSA